MTAQQITRALGGRWYGSYGTARCLVHDDREPSMVLRDGDSALLVRCYAGCDPSDVLDALRSRGLIEGKERDPTAANWQRRRQATEQDVATIRDRETRIKRAREIWRAARPAAAGTRVQRYLASRGITEPPPQSIRFAPSLWHGPSQQEWPAMIAAVQAPGGAIRGIHRTYLAKDGTAKAPVSPAKMMLGDCMGGAVRFAAAGADLAIAEGIETALSFQQMTGIATWAALSTSGIRSILLPPLPLVELVYLIVDADPAGEACCKSAAHRFAGEGRRVKLARPTRGKDMNDVVGLAIA